MTRHLPLSCRYLAFAISCFVCACVFGDDADWPQWRGPHRDGHAAPQSLMNEWETGGPKVKWSFNDAGVGYSAFSIVGDRLYTMGSRGYDCFTICLNADDGKMVWQTITSRSSNENDYAHGWGGGPRATPTVDGDFVYSLSDVGVLACLNRHDGKLIWSADFVNQFNGAIPKWGYSESVLVDGDRVVGTPGGSSFMVGFDKADGHRVWSSQDAKEAAQYVSIIKHDFAGKSLYITASKTGLIGIHADSGKTLFKNSSTGNDVAVIPTPIASDNLIYHTSDYNAGNTLLSLSEKDSVIDVEVVYHLSAKSMQNHHGGVVLVDGVIYGFTKAGGGDWMAQDFKSGETLWTEKIRPNRSGSITYADGRLYCYNDEDGSVILVEPSRDGWKNRGELKLPSKTQIARGSGAIWAHPTIANQTLYLRDQDLIFAFDIAK